MTRLHDVARDGRLLISRKDWRMGLNFRSVDEAQEKQVRLGSRFTGQSDCLSPARKSGVPRHHRRRG